MNSSSIFKQLLKLKIDFSLNASRRGFGKQEKIVWWVTLYYPGGYEMIEGTSLEKVMERARRFLKKNSYRLK